MGLTSFMVTHHLGYIRVPTEETIPQDPEFFKKYGTREVLHLGNRQRRPNGRSFGRVGKQKIENSGQLKERMETVDEEIY
jgi:arylsulfatase